VTIRLLATAALASALAGCGFVGNGGERQAAVVRGICLDCHNTAEQTGGLDLERRKLDAVASDAETWEKAILKVRSNWFSAAQEASGPSTASSGIGTINPFQTASSPLFRR